LTPDKEAIVLQSFISSNKLNHGVVEVIASSVLNSGQQQAVERGKVFHEALSKINDRSDINAVLDNYENVLSKQDHELLKVSLDSILNNVNFKTIYNKNNTIYNEREFISNGKVLIPDRVEVDESGVIYIIDYKTGVKDKKYEQQIEEYAMIFKDLIKKTVKKYIIYIGDQLQIEEVK